jgi:hypothetical protein
VKCSVESAADVIISIFYLFTHFAILCATAPAGKLEFAIYFLQEAADLKAFDVYCAAFRNISLAFNKTTSTLHLMKEVQE